MQVEVEFDATLELLHDAVHFMGWANKPSVVGKENYETSYRSKLTIGPYYVSVNATTELGRCWGVALNNSVV